VITLTADRIVRGTDDLGAGWIGIEGDTIVALGSGTPPEAPREHIAGSVVPGFVDIHCHGALGSDFGSADDGGVRSIIDHHARRGTTRLIASLASAPLDVLETQLRLLGGFVTRGELDGIHLEGPYLSVGHRGAHDPALLRTPDLTEMESLVEAGAGGVRMVTIAPELPGAEAVIRRLVERGIVVAIGHTSCDAETARAAIGWGATVMTHLFNGMPALHHREPGPAAVGLLDDRITAELILDGHHVSPEFVELARRSAGARVALVSDAMAATGCGDGEYRIGGSAVRVHGGVAMLSDGSSLAGSTITVADGFHTLVDRLGWSLATAIEATSSAAARAIRLPRSGLETGADADLVVVQEGTVARVMRRGAWLE
jgi:N-acetylglucosamine-6-phosphate deacetylase